MKTGDINLSIYIRLCYLYTIDFVVHIIYHIYIHFVLNIYTLHCFTYATINVFTPQKEKQLLVAHYLEFKVQ